jgi:hypothetical protein
MSGAFACRSPEVICRRFSLPARSPTTRPAANSNHRYLQLSRIQDPQILIANPVGILQGLNVRFAHRFSGLPGHPIGELPGIASSVIADSGELQSSHLPRIGDKHASDFLDIEFGYKNALRLRGYSYAKWPRQIHHARSKVVRYMEWSIKPGVPKFVG